MYGKKVALIERGRLGGTCVNVGCVPKKIMWNAAQIKETIEHIAPGYGFPGATTGGFDWTMLKERRDAYIKRLNGMYERNLSEVDVFEGFGSLAGKADCGGFANVSVAKTGGGDVRLTAPHVLIATGGYPSLPAVEGKELCMTSDEFFDDLAVQPKRVAVVGAGYIAVEVAGVMASLGSQVSMFVRGDGALRSFDTLIQDFINKSLVSRDEIDMVTQANLRRVTLSDDGSKTIELTNGEVFEGFDEVICAIGREPLVSDVGLDSVLARDGASGIGRTEQGHIVSNEYQETGVDGIYALGDVCGFWELTPVAIAAGRRLADRLFSENPKCRNAKLDYTNIPTVIFSHPTVGTIGDTEAEAYEKYGRDDVTVYTSVFVNMWFSLQDVEPSQKERTHIKLICVGEEEKVVGLHIVGMASDEILQGFGVAIKMGATKADFDSCVAIHPTAAEEVVTLAPWGLKKGEL
jgi:glutathione reductase (NADPH)